MKKIAIVGHPVSHSKSPLIHNYWIKQHSLDASYEAIDVTIDDFELKFKEMVDAGYHGFNFTIPHKIMALDYCDIIEPVAQEMRAINTVYKKGSQIVGTNTDSFGFIEHLKTQAPQFDIRNDPSVVIGAGGAARAVVYGLLREGAKEIRILNRTQSKAEAIAVRDARVKVWDWEERESALPESGLLVNTTSLGMVGQPELDLDLFMLPQDTIVYDIVYAPLKTQLLEECEERGNQVINGLGMLVHQARKGFEHWFGILPDYDEGLFELLHAELEAAA